LLREATLSHQAVVAEKPDVGRAATVLGIVALELQADLRRTRWKRKPGTHVEPLNPEPAVVVPEGPVLAEQRPSTHVATHAHEHAVHAVGQVHAEGDLVVDVGEAGPAALR